MGISIAETKSLPRRRSGANRESKSGLAPLNDGVGPDEAVDEVDDRSEEGWGSKWSFADEKWKAEPYDADETDDDIHRVVRKENDFQGTGQTENEDVGAEEAMLICCIESPEVKADDNKASDPRNPEDEGGRRCPSQTCIIRRDSKLRVHRPCGRPFSSDNLTKKGKCPRLTYYVA
jgi:hypothetical protein